MADSVRVLLKVMSTVVAGIVITLLIVSFALFQRDVRVYPSNVFVSGISLAGLSREEAYEVLNNNFSSKQEEKMLLEFSDSLISVPLHECGISYDIESTLKKADSLFYGENAVIALLRHSIIRGKRQDVAPVFSYDENRLYDKIIEIKKEFDKSSVDARILYNGGYLEYLPHEYGRIIDVAGSIENISAALGKGLIGSIELAITEVSPRIKLNDIKKVQDTLGAYVGLFDVNGLDSVRCFVSGLNGLIIMPGETISLNKFAGQQGEIVIKGDSGNETVSEVKNAFCQTCLQAGLEIEEDSFIVTNNHTQPILLTAVIEGEKLTIKIFGCQLEKGKKISIITEEEEILPKVRMKVDSRLLPQQQIIEQEGKNGLIVRTYRVVSKYGEETEKTLLTEEIFPAVDTIISVGPESIRK